MQLTYKNVQLPIELRIDAARAAIAYERPRLAVMSANITSHLTLEQLVLRSRRNDADEEPEALPEAAE